MYKIGDEGEPTVEHRELYLMLCGYLNGKEIQERGYIYLYTWADSFCCTVETNTQHCKATILQ